MSRTLTMLLALGALVGGPSLAAAQGEGGGRTAGAPQAQQPTGFTPVEVQAIRVYFASHEQQVRPLPPGIARNLARGKPLPAGIAKQQLPAALKSSLPVREGVEISLFGDRVILEVGGVVADVLEGVFKR